MSVLEVLTFPHPILKKKSQDVEEVNSKIQELVQNMFESMYAKGNGIGLAAPQVGESLNIFVMDVPKEDPEDPEDPEDEDKFIKNPICMINPKIIHQEGIITWEEGCLSCPELLVEVERSNNIIVESLDAEGRPQKLTLSELESVCTQHEMDHLEGKLLVDRVSRLKRDMYRKQRVRERKDDDDVSVL